MEVSWQSKMILLHGCSRTWTWGKSALGDDEKILEKNNVFIHRKLKLRLVDMKNNMIWDIWVVKAVKAYPLFMLFCCRTNTIQWRHAIFYLTKVISIYFNDILWHMNILYVKYIKHMWHVHISFTLLYPILFYKIWFHIGIIRFATQKHNAFGSLDFSSQSWTALAWDFGRLPLSG